MTDDATGPNLRSDPAGLTAGRHAGSPAVSVTRPGAQVPAQRIEQGRGHHGDPGDRDWSREAEHLGHQLEQGRADRADHYRSGRAGLVCCPLGRRGPRRTRKTL